MKMTKEKYPEDQPRSSETVRIPQSMLSAVEEFLGTEIAKSRGFRFKSDVVTAAVRELLDRYSAALKPRFIHYNVYEDHVSIIDNEQPEGKNWVDVYFQNSKAWCDLCEKHDCDHTQFALSLPEVVNVLEEKGWVVEDGKIMKGPQ
jgi:hypothetical protein